MSANPKVYLTENQIVNRLMAIVDEKDRTTRRALIEEFNQTNGPDVCRAVLEKYGLHMGLDSGEVEA
jgi:hypothetical protein